MDRNEGSFDMLAEDPNDTGPPPVCIMELDPQLTWTSLGPSATQHTDKFGSNINYRQGVLVNLRVRAPTTKTKAGLCEACEQSPLNACVYYVSDGGRESLSPGCESLGIDPGSLFSVQESSCRNPCAAKRDTESTANRAH